MLRIFNDKFFSFDIKTSIDGMNGIRDTLLNVLVEPKEFDLKQYKKTPFATFSSSMKNGINVSQSNGVLTSSEIPEYFFDAQFNQYSKYEDNEYDIILSHFDDSRAHTLIFDTSDISDMKTCCTNDDRRLAHLDKIILLIAMPIKGIVAPVKKSPHFKLYNGAFISCKVFPWHGDYYNKLVYYLVDMSTSFSFQEYIQTENGEVGIMHNYYFSLDYNKDITMQKLTSIVPYRGRENLFSKPERNLFFLSDIPPEIINRQASISVPISSDLK